MERKMYRKVKKIRLKFCKIREIYVNLQNNVRNIVFFGRKSQETKKFTPASETPCFLLFR